MICVECKRHFTPKRTITSKCVSCLVGFKPGVIHDKTKHIENIAPQVEIPPWDLGLCPRERSGVPARTFFVLPNALSRERKQTLDEEDGPTALALLQTELQYNACESTLVKSAITLSKAYAQNEHATKRAKVAQEGLKQMGSDSDCVSLEFRNLWTKDIRTEAQTKNECAFREESLTFRDPLTQKALLDQNVTKD